MLWVRLMRMTLNMSPHLLHITLLSFWHSFTYKITYTFTDKTLGNTGGMGGLFGPLYCIGKGFPFPEAKPYSPSWQFRAFSAIGNLAQKIGKLTAKK